ncbi:ATP-binding protein [Desulfococcaceae bacterium HSG8]|nr:ATP-binding protein [Desulfococcaceae bacterium HSG8]
MRKLQRLPIGDSSFESIRANECVYVDKTRHLFQMADEGKYYFMSRPRRFGKSLTVSTLRCMFQGKKDLFDGLWIAENTEWEWKPHPVVLLDFNEISHDTPENLKLSLQRTLHQSAGDHDLSSDAPLLKNQFKELILSLYQKTGMPVVILIDEYDKPLIDHLGKGEKALETAKANRDILKYFFGVIKGGDVSSALRLVFITGVSKFTRVSIFSELNNLEDLTMTETYSDMLGYTREELETYFPSHIRLLSEKTGIPETEIMEKLERHYDGYRFSKRDIRVYNPFSILSALKQKDFRNYWFETGTPAFLVNLLKDNGWYLPEIETMRATEAVFSTYELEDLRPEALLFQTGYLTIRDVTERLYTFDYPNQEVKTSFLEILFHSWTRGLRDSSQFVLLAGYLQREEYEQFIETMSAIFASIPYALETKRDEAYFHTVFYLMVCASGVNARSEIMTCKGRIDLAMEFPDKIYIIEFKCNQSAQAGIDQIREKGYADKYRQRGKKIILMGINFDSEERNISEWKKSDLIKETESSSPDSALQHT